MMFTVFPTYEHLKEWCEANAEGRLLILPCKVGKEVFNVRGDIKPDTIERFSFGENGLEFETLWYEFRNICEIGKTVFLSREEGGRFLTEKRKFSGILGKTKKNNHLAGATRPFGFYLTNLQVMVLWRRKTRYRLK